MSELKSKKAKISTGKVKVNGASSKKIDENKPNGNTNKYEKLINKKRKLEDADHDEVHEIAKSESKKPRLLPKNDNIDAAPKKIKSNGFASKNKPSKEFENKKKVFADKKNGFNNKNGKSTFKKPSDDKAKVVIDKKEQKELRKQRRQKKLAENYDTTINVKKIWETLRRSETTDDTKKKLCSTLYENVKGKINQMALAHDTCRVIECLVQYGNEAHRNGVFNELKDNLIELSKSKYARFMIKKLLSYCNKEQQDILIRAFTGRVTKLIKHSFACQIIETIFNEHANFAQRNQMLLEFYDPTLAILHEKKYKCLNDVLVDQPLSKEKILNNLKEILTSCVDKTLLMFSIIHRVFLEYFLNCEQAQKSEMIDLLAEHLVHMIHTKDGAQVAMMCIWYGSAKDRKKIIKAMKSFFLKIALEEHGHLVLLAIFDSVDDTKFVSKGILEELFRSIKELFDNEYGRKVITYLIAPRDSKFFLKDYVKRLEAGDSKETSKKDTTIRRKELFEYSKVHLKNFLIKEISEVLYNGACGILIPFIIEKLGSDADELIKKMADILLDKRFEPSNEEKNSKDKDTSARGHYIEDATCHFVIKKIIDLDSEREKNSNLTLTQALLSNKNAMYMRSWIECNRGCFALVKLIEVGNSQTKKKIKVVLEDCLKDLMKETSSGAKILLQKLNEI